MPPSPTPLQKPNFSEAARKFRSLVLSSPEDIRRRFGTKPITLLRLIDTTMRFPKKLRIIFACLWLQKDLAGNPATRFIIKGPRGGGKSKMLGALGFVKWFLQLLNIVDMGGSLMQAQGVYNYFTGPIYEQPAILDALPSEPTMSKTESDQGNYFKAVAASQKQVRGPHPDALFIDEACETKDELILSAIPMVNTSDRSLVVATSTFHKIFGWFQEQWDEADALGWVRLSWDSFDVVRSFDPAIWQDEKLRREIPDLSIEQAGDRSLEHRAAGRTGDPEGWIPVVNMIQAWREKASIDYFDIEYMGSRPSTEGMVNDPADVDACVIDELGEYAYRKGMETAAGLDWGFSGMTAWTALGAHKDQVKAQLASRQWSQVRSSVIIEDIVSDVLEYRIGVIHADASHPFENADLRAAINRAISEVSAHEQFRCIVVEVPFGRPVQVAERDKNRTKKRDVKKNLGTEKEVMLGNYKAYFERHLLRILRECKTAIWQHKRYRYQKGSDKPVKEDDHIPDSTMLALRRWTLGKGPSPMVDDTPATRRQSTVTGGLLEETF